MLRDPDTGDRVCEVCKTPFDRQYARLDTKTCGSKCRQQAYRNRKQAEQDEHYAKIQADRHFDRDRRDRYNANRKKARAKKRRAGSKA